ncbi:DUF29 domain-containing protein [Thiorhodococcus mannitoliphagus]|uniref:DUF29 domain-containing protein n=1 Tax=Thiorhodococcus mannitoliphagus TaxID=329406 RepID=A0A6P1E2G5_9GAMM|nr:DUF29 domain-containing protein [Thiorhodococcus mannitoliphagus]NEX23541.1 DUF29 domain-containing protein [Thiorhodococcus mannitoliphagus]
MTTTPYEQDYHAWAQETAHLIRQRRFLEIDIEHLAEEIEDIGASREREIESRLGVLLAHLLEWRYQPERRGASWEATIKEQRQRIVRLLRKNPSLTAKLEEIIQDAYSDARLIARRETGLPEETVPPDNPDAWELRKCPSTTSPLSQRGARGDFGRHRSQREIIDGRSLTIGDHWPEAA